MNYSIDWDGPGEWDDDDDRPLCLRCNGEGEVTCHCGGDLCLCGEGDVPCPACGGSGRVSQERLDRQIAAHRAIMTAIWGEGWDARPDEKDRKDG